MKTPNKLLKYTLCGLVFFASTISAQTWEMKQAPLMTEWSKTVQNNPEGAYTSYPRPQMVRDNWQNLNGIWDLAKVAKNYVMPTARQSNSCMWKYTKGGVNYTIADGWNTDLNYNDSQWAEGASGFGAVYGDVRTDWKSETIYLRKKITIRNLTSDELSKLKLDVFHDEDFQLYINGVLAAEATGHTSDYQTMNINASAKTALNLGGENLIAIKCIQKTGWQYIDAGLFIDGERSSFGVYADLDYNQKILVPFPVESAISGIMDTDIADTKKWYAYKRTFSVPESMSGKQILLHFGAVDWRCKVFVNKKEVGLHEGGYDPFYFDITEALTAGENQELVVHVYDPSSAGGQPRGKQTTNPGVIQYTPASGIWQTVWIEGVNSTHIRRFYIVPDIDNKKAVFTVEAQGAARGVTVNIKVFKKGVEVASIENAAINTNVELSIPNPVLWDTKNPFLYDVKFELLKAGELVDEVSGYFGMRKVSLGQFNGFPWVMLNNKPIYQYGTLDQGYWPDGIYTAPNEEALLYDIHKTKEYGFNMIRKHIKTEPAIWYHACDTMGILVWQDMPNSSDGILGNRDWQKNQFYKEERAIITALRNHPSIVTWVIMNESWGQFDENGNSSHTQEGVRIAKELDNTRVINSVSGWNDYGLGDIYDRHSYSNPAIYIDRVRASVCGETGGISYIDEAHKWSDAEMEYVKVETPEALKNLFISFVDEVKGWQTLGMCATVYTQITDVEMEPNGLLYYDRVVKNTPAQVEAIRNSLQSAINDLSKYVVKTANEEKSDWKYTTTHPDGNWFSPTFNDSGWSVGKSGFGAKNGYETALFGTVIGTEWNTTNIWLRRKVTLDLTDEEFESLKASIYYDENFELYINGVLAASGTGFSTVYKSFDIAPAAKAAIVKQGENTIAIHCKQISGAQYIDFGLTTKQPVPEDPEPPSNVVEVKRNFDIGLYPNPTSGAIHFYGDDAANIQHITLYNINGTMIKNFQKHLASLDISPFDKGIYMLRIETDKDSCVKKIIKN